MNLGHLSASQLSYLEGLVEKCAELGVDPRYVIKLSQAAQTAQPTPPAPAPAPVPAPAPAPKEESASILGGLKHWWDAPATTTAGKILEGITTTPWEATGKALGGGYKTEDPAEIAKQMRPYSARSYDYGGNEIVDPNNWRSLVRNLNRQGTPGALPMKAEDKAKAEYYRKMLESPKYKALASQPMTSTPGAEMWEGIKHWLTGRNFDPKAKASYEGTQRQLALARAQEAFRKGYEQNVEFKPSDTNLYAGRPSMLRLNKWVPDPERPYNEQALYARQ